jgi:thiamine-phosphate pyrophosphorylase
VTAVQRCVAGLYAVTPEHLGEERLLLRAEQALAGGARVLQYRDKGTDTALRMRRARTLAALCRDHGALFIVNDDVGLALASAAGGVHLGRDDVSVTQARAALGPQAVIGASCYDDLSRAERSVQAGADYLAFGSFFPSTVKPAAVRAPLALLQEARRRFALPLVAIGGITPHNAGQVIQAGADAVAVVTALFDAPDTRSAALCFTRLFEPDVTALSSMHSS